MANMSYGGGQGSSYYDLARKGQIFSALALVTSPVIYSTAAATGGPLLWNNSDEDGLFRVNAVLLAVGIGMTTASGAASVLGITGNTGQEAAPATTTTIDAGPVNTNIGGPSTGSQCHVYRIGTPTNAGNFFQPTHSLDTAAITATPLALQWADIAGSIIVGPASWASIAAGATATSAVLQVGLLWAEIPF
jgi:hypothetical protein